MSVENKTKHYPSHSKARFTDNIKSLFQSLKTRERYTNYTAQPELLVRLNDSELEKRISDHWVNEIANLSSGNSIMQHSKFILNRMTYQELAMLAGADDIINNAIETITRECLAQWGDIEVTSELDTLEIKEFLENRLKELDFKNKVAELIRKSLTYGGGFAFFSYGGLQDLEKPLVLSKETSINKLLNISIIEAWLVAPNEVNLNNPTEQDYMKPRKWYVSGAGVVDSTRLYPLVFFEAPNLIKPMFNFLGISLAQFMRDKVRGADSMRQSLQDIFLRFRTNIIRTPSLMSMDKETLKQRVELINMGVNNFSTLLLADTENFEQSITPIAGLDKIYAQALETIASSARIPINKLFGQTPTGLNNSGQYDITNFYDIVKGYQETTIKPFIEKVLDMLLNEKYADLDIRAEFKFKPLQKLNENELAQVRNIEADYYTKLINAGIITQEEALQELKAKDYLSSDVTGESDNDLDMDVDLDLGLDNDLDMDVENGKNQRDIPLE